MAKPNPNAPPASGSRLSVRVDAALSDDLTVLMREGALVSDAVRIAVGVLADAFRGAWSTGAYPDGIVPDVVGMTLAPYDERPTL